MTLKRVRVTIVAVEKQEVVNIMGMCICILALGIRHANRIFFCAVLCCRLWPGWLFTAFYILSHKRVDFREKKIIQDCF